MFRLDNLLERWAELYRPLSHNGVATTPAGSATTPGGFPSGSRKSFFRIGMIDAQSYFMRNFSSMAGACMAYATHVDAEINKQNPKALSYRHVIYFLIKQPAGTLATNQVTDEIGPTEARFQTDDMVQDLLAVLFRGACLHRSHRLRPRLPRGLAWFAVGRSPLGHPAPRAQRLADLRTHHRTDSPPPAVREPGEIHIIGW